MDYENKKPTIGVFVGPGAFRGVYHDGFFAAARDHKIEISQYVGVSAGFWCSVASIAEVDVTKHYVDPYSPMYTDMHKRDVFTRFLDYHLDRIFEESPHTESELLGLLNKKLSAIATRISLPLRHDVLDFFESKEDVKNVQCCTASIPWFISPWPARYRGAWYLDGAVCLSEDLLYLNTDIKVILESTMSTKLNKSSAHEDIYHFKNKYGRTWKTALHLNINDAMRMIDLGYEQGDEFFKHLKTKYKEL